MDVANNSNLYFGPGQVTNDIGDPSASHFNITNPGANWVDLDLSSYIKPGHRTAVLSVYGRTANTAGHYKFLMKTKGVSYLVNVREYPPASENGYGFNHLGNNGFVVLGLADYIIKVDANNTIQYASYSGNAIFTNVWITVVNSLP